MEQSRRAVESYWRSKVIDVATSDEDKVTPVYKLEEICDLLRSSHISIVKEVSQFILKRLDHKSPIVKQKALRVIKYAVGKSGAEFKREMQKNSVSVRQLIHYRGQPDPLKGDALNKAVRETAQETLSTLFSSDDSVAAPTESSLRSRIQGFGNTNYEMPSDDRKSFISEVVDIGSATIRQGFSNLKQSPSMRKSNDTGSYRSPNLERSLAKENDYSDRYEGVGSRAEYNSSSRFSKNAGTGSWGEESSTSQSETSNGGPALTYSQKNREEKLLETIVTSTGVRLQPTRDALHVFLVEASKLDSESLAHAIEMKLRSPMWQVRMKALCVLEALLRKKNDGHFSVISLYFSDNKDVVVQCSESPQASLREKATKVLSLLGGEQNGSGTNHFKQSTKIHQPSMIPDMINTDDPDDLLGMEDPQKAASEPKVTNAPPSVAPLINDLLGDNFDNRESTNNLNFDDDPFADVSFHTSQDNDRVTDLFSGMALDMSGASEARIAAHKNESEPFNLLNSSSEVLMEQGTSSEYATNLMDGMPVNGNDSSAKKNASSDDTGSNILGSVSSADNKSPNVALNNAFPLQASEMNVNAMFPMGAMAYNIPSGFGFNPAFASQPMNYSAMGSHFAQQQFLAAMSNLHQLGNLQSSTTINSPGSVGGNAAPLPDIFNPGIATQPPTSLMNGSKREDTKAFDFISDHVASARDTKRMT
ncbi:protein MODIFIED TRANSPORT TO THE VACUOLE 1-like [Salvia hispanica]|uniref:protein MODIFIED TRANSPORT TO THE VACUOLE 1-like n=1 Tax=Salvia hispanica TaxID=49212 RepID=UPI002009963D|nr:protein MODIFIED TRANSPORT TO THE VACUOLE 1-like [Salvia hispanica]